MTVTSAPADTADSPLAAAVQQEDLIDPAVRPAGRDGLAAAAQRPWSHPLLVLAAVVLALVAGGTAVAVTVHRPHHRSTGPVANQRPDKLPVAVPSAPATVTAADGTVLHCPTGAEPTIALAGAAFTPALVDGQLVGKGRYHIRLTGIVQNETSAAIAVSSVTVFINDARWDATVTVASQLAAQTSADLVIEGTYRSPGAGTPSIHTNLNWNWSSADLAPCGDRGLIEDD
jgi:hypothetical protein